MSWAKRSSSPATQSARLVQLNPGTPRGRSDTQGDHSDLIVGKIGYEDSSAVIRFNTKQHSRRRKIVSRRYRRSAELPATTQSILKLTRRFSQKLRSIPGNIPIPLFRDLEQTWPHFLEEYSKMTQDLSVVDRPLCFNGYGFMSPPLAYNETRRTTVTRQYLDNNGWNNREYLKDLVRPLLQRYNIAGASVSLLDRTRQIVKYSVGLSMEVISRSVSLDGHAILSGSPMVLLDASCDWRMVYNPLVHGPPFIRFYVGVPLLATENEDHIGILAFFDPYVRFHVQDELLADMIQVSKSIMEFIDYRTSSISARIESCSENTSDAGSLVGLSLNPLRNTNKNIDRSNGQDKGIEGTNGQEILLPHECTVRYNADSLQRLSCNPTLLKSYEISRYLMECDDAKDVSTRACQILAQALGLDFVYVLEVRVTALHRVSKHNLRFPSGVSASTIPNIAGILGPERDKHVRVRLLGGFGLQLGKEYQFDPDVHVLALNSPFGVQYNASSEKTVPYQAGIFMPFRKSDSQIAYSFGQQSKRASVAKPNVKDDGGIGMSPDGSLDKFGDDGLAEEFNSKVTFDENDENPEIVITEDLTQVTTKQSKRTFSQTNLVVKSRYGGFVMAGFSAVHRYFSPGDVEYMKLCVKAMDNIFSCS